MKILLVSNFYPSHYQGGYEVPCKQAVETIQHRGHEVRILTSVSGLPMDSPGGFPRQTEVIAGVRMDVSCETRFCKSGCGMDRLNSQGDGFPERWQIYNFLEPSASRVAQAC